MKYALCLLVTLAACGDDDATVDASQDAAVEAAADAAGEDLALNDVALDVRPDSDVLPDVGVDSDVPFDGDVPPDGDVRVDAAIDASPDASLGDSCSSACAATLVRASGAAMETFDLAFFGFNGDGTLYIEVYGDAEPECPDEDSPSPGRTMVLGSVPVFTSTEPLRAMAVLFDFEGTLTSEPLLRSPDATIEPVALLAEAGAEGFLRFELNIPFAGVSVAGSVYARHCASLDG
ncbi:MAG: hypothetical protein AAF411_01055 [Myxococcota bacterium]